MALRANSAIVRRRYVWLFSPTSGVRFPNWPYTTDPMGLNKTLRTVLDVVRRDYYSLRLLTRIRSAKGIFHLLAL